MSKPPARILLADDHRLVAEGVRELLESRYEVIGIVEDGLAVLDAVARQRPDLLLIDLSMPQLDGLEAIRQLRRGDSSLPIIVLTMHDDAGHIKAAFEAGADGFLVKTSASRELTEAIETVLGGQRYLTPTVTGKMLETFRSPNPAPAASPLTPREFEIADLITKGLENSEIAKLLCVAEVTVRSHFRRILNKLNLRNRVELARYILNR